MVTGSCHPLGFLGVKKKKSYNLKVKLLDTHIDEHLYLLSLLYSDMKFIPCHYMKFIQTLQICSLNSCFAN